VYALQRPVKGVYALQHPVRGVYALQHGRGGSPRRTMCLRENLKHARYVDM